MLPDRVCQLLTASIDGELSARERRAVSRLLARSLEAREMLEQLQEDAKLVGSLARQKLDAEFPQRVLKAIAERQPPLVCRVQIARMPAYPAWAGLATAAAVLLMVGVSTYLYFVNAGAKPATGNVASSHQRVADTVAEGEKKADPPIAEIATKPEKEPAKAAKPTDPIKESPVAVVQQPKEKPTDKPPPPMKEAEPSTDLASPADPTPKMEVFEKLNLRLSLLVSLRELDKDKPRLQLREELKKEKAFRLELACLGNGKAMERLQQTFQAQGMRLLVDESARTRLKNPRLKTDFVLYSEDLTGDELAKILEQLGVDDKKAGTKEKQVQFGQLSVNAMTDADRKNLSDTLGLGAPTAPAKKGPLGVDIRKPLSDGTAEDVAKAAAGQGSPRPGNGKPPAAKAPERVAVLLAYNPVRSRPDSSKELKQYLEGRKERRAGTIQVLLFLRGANG